MRCIIPINRLHFVINQGFINPTVCPAVALPYLQIQSNIFSIIKQTLCDTTVFVTITAHNIQKTNKNTNTIPKYTNEQGDNNNKI